MVVPQSPASQIFGPAQVVSAGDVAAQGRTPIAAIEANHIVTTQTETAEVTAFFGKGLLTEPAKASVDDYDEIRKLICSDFMVPQVTPNDFRGELPMTVFGFDGSLPRTIFCFAL